MVSAALEEAALFVPVMCLIGSPVAETSEILYSLAENEGKNFPWTSRE